MRMPPFLWILHFMHLTGGQDGARRSASVGRHCPAGCATCSASNGCLSCKPRLFFHLELDGMRQRGACVSSCPRGHYGARSPHISTCARCKDDCSSCFSESFCTHCHPGHFLHRGKCENRCPDGLTANAVLRECTECSAGCEVCVRGVCVKCRADADLLDGQCHLVCPAGFEPDLQLMHCVPQVHFEVGGWTVWGPCACKRSTQTHRRGSAVTPAHNCQRSGGVLSERKQSRF